MKTRNNIVQNKLKFLTALFSVMLDKNLFDPLVVAVDFLIESATDKN